MSDDHLFMQAALAQAQLALDAGEVPVGAVVVREGRVIASGFNQTRAHADPCAHAEILAIRQAAAVLGNYRLEGCSLYVTLEPCAMCSGAALTARLDQVVYGAAEPKTGAAGSVVNLFAQSQLNHQTRLRGDVLAAPSQALLQGFFQSRRLNKKATHAPLRDDALRTPEERFAALPDYPWASRYRSDLPSLQGLRMHYLDEILDEVGQGAGPDAICYVCLHSSPGWSYVYRQMIPLLLQAGHRVVAPDGIGFGKSDKPKKAHAYGPAWHAQVMHELIEALDLRRVVLVVQDWVGLLGLRLIMAAPERYVGLLVVGEVEAEHSAPKDASSLEAYEAPFPNRGYCAMAQALAAAYPPNLTEPGPQLAEAAVRYFKP